LLIKSQLLIITSKSNKRPQFAAAKLSGGEAAGASPLEAPHKSLFSCTPGFPLEILVGVKTPFLTTRGFAPQILLGGKIIFSTTAGLTASILAGQKTKFSCTPGFPSEILHHLGKNSVFESGDEVSLRESWRGRKQSFHARQVLLRKSSWGGKITFSTTGVLGS
jgi:hypothetical protein